MWPHDGSDFTTGFWVVTVGILGFVAGCYVPAFRSFGGRFDIYHALYWHDGGLGTVGTSLLLFSGAVVTAGLTLIGILGCGRIWLLPSLVAAVAIWSLTWTSFLLTLIIPGRTPLVGYWIVVGSLVLGVVGAIIAVGSRPSPLRMS